MHEKKIKKTNETTNTPGLEQSSVLERLQHPPPWSFPDSLLAVLEWRRYRLMPGLMLWQTILSVVTYCKTEKLKMKQAHTQNFQNHEYTMLYCHIYVSLTFYEGVPKDVMVGREAIHIEMRLNTQFSLPDSNWMRLLESDSSLFIANIFEHNTILKMFPVNNHNLGFQEMIILNPDAQ